MENLLTILQSSGAAGTDDVLFLNMDTLEGNEFLGPQIDDAEAIEGMEDAEEGYENE